MDGIIEEICRVRNVTDIRHASLRKWQDYLRLEIQPKLDIYNDLMAKASAGLPKPKRGTDVSA
jgi:hypothetical protein